MNLRLELTIKDNPEQLVGNQNVQKMLADGKGNNV